MKLGRIKGTLCPPMSWLVTGKTGSRFGLCPGLNCWNGSCTISVKLTGSGGLNWRWNGRLCSVADKPCQRAELCLAWVRALASARIIFFSSSESSARSLRLYSHIKDQPKSDLSAKRTCFCLLVHGPWQVPGTTKRDKTRVISGERLYEGLFKFT